MNVKASSKSLARVMNKGQSLLLLAIRLYIGYQCAISGYGHLTNFHDSIDNFKEWNIPLPAVSVAIAGTTELIGGVLLLIGLAARIISIPLIFNFLVAIVSTDLAYPGSRIKILHFWRPEGQSLILKDTAFPFLIAAILILFFGPGLFSVDRAIGLE